MPQAGRSRPLTSRSVSTKITPITETKMILTPASGSIGAACVCMCWMPCCHRSTYWANHGSPRLGVTDANTNRSTASTTIWAARTKPAVSRARRSPTVTPASASTRNQVCPR